MADIAITAANVRASAQAKRLVLPFPTVPIAGAAITAGQPVYQGTDTFFYPATATVADPAYKVAGIAENSAAAGQAVGVVYEDPDFQFGGTGVIGDILILSGATTGGIAPAADSTGGWVNSVLMILFSTTLANFKIIRSDVAKP
jgi:hypothetical protein